MSVSFSQLYCSGEVVDKGPKDMVVKGRINDRVVGGVIHYVAAAPPDYRATFTGSGLPFANAEMAFSQTPNRGVVKLGLNNSFEIKLAYPNAYYAGLGTVYVPPTLYISYKAMNFEKTVFNDREVAIKVSEGIPYRFLTYPGWNTKARKDAGFYAGVSGEKEVGWDMPVRTQEQILRDSAYPMKNIMDEGYWGVRPAI